MSIEVFNKKLLWYTFMLKKNIFFKLHNTIGSFESIPNASAPYHEDIFTMLEVAYHNHVLSLQGERNAIMKYTDKKPMTSKFIHLFHHYLNLIFLFIFR